MEELMEGAEEEETTEGVGVEPETGKEERETEIIEEETEDIEDVDDLLKDLEL